MTLFDRRAGGVRATAAGRLLGERAEAALAHLAGGIRAGGRGGGRGFARPDLLMTATQLHAFLALAEAGGFSGAALRTSITQPALHRAVRDLEQVCGVALAERSGRGVAVTPAGRRLARGIRLAAGELAAAIGELAPERAGPPRIVVGAMPLSRALLIPGAAAAFVGEGQRATVDVREGSWRELVDPLRDGALDMMVGALRDPPPAGLVQELLFEDALVVVGRAGHPLGTVAAPSLDEYRRYGWIIGQPDTPLRRHWQALFAGGPLPAAPIECGSVMVIRGILQNSDLLTLLSPDQVALEIANGALCRIGAIPPHGRRAIGIVTRAGWQPTAGQRRFVELLRETTIMTRVHEIE